MCDFCNEMDASPFKRIAEFGKNHCPDCNPDNYSVFKRLTDGGSKTSKTTTGTSTTTTEEKQPTSASDTEMAAYSLSADQLEDLSKKTKGVRIPGSGIADIYNIAEELKGVDGSKPTDVNKKLAELYGKKILQGAATMLAPAVAAPVLGTYEIAELARNKLKDPEYKKQYDKDNPGLHRPGEW